MKKNIHPRAVMIALGLCFVTLYFFFLPNFRPKQTKFDDCTYNAGEHWIKLTGNNKVLSDNLRVYNPSTDPRSQRSVTDNNKCVRLDVLDKSTLLCVYDPGVDKYISSSILAGGRWEDTLVRTVGAALRKHPNMAYLDLGCNIGAIAMLPVLEGRRVVAVDPNIMNIRLLSKSLCLGKLHENVTLLLNAISDKEEVVLMGEEAANVGGMSAKKVDSIDSQGDLKHRAYAVPLDALTVFFKGEDVFIKMDIEGFEYNALKGGERFMQDINVKYLLMEWFQHMGKDTGDDIIKFMIKYDFIPHDGEDMNVKLSLQNNASWPANVLWVKKNV